MDIEINLLPVIALIGIMRFITKAFNYLSDIVPKVLKRIRIPIRKNKSSGFFRQ